MSKRKATYRNYHQYSNDLELNLWLVKVAQMLYDLVASNADCNDCGHTRKLVNQLDVSPLKWVERSFRLLPVYHLSLTTMLSPVNHFF